MLEVSRGNRGETTYLRICTGLAKHPRFSSFHLIDRVRQIRCERRDDESKKQPCYHITLSAQHAIIFTQSTSTPKLSSKTSQSWSWMWAEDMRGTNQ